MGKLEVEYVPVTELRTYENNAKIHTGEQVEQIKRSIEEFGFNDPIAVWKDNVIIEGHGRLIAAIELGMDKIPVIRLDGLTDEQRRAYGLIHNKLTMNTEFEFSALEEELSLLDSFDMNFYGFSIDSEDDEDSEFGDLQGFDDKYTQETKIPHYEPRNAEVDIPNLYDISKRSILIQRIQASNVSEREKAFLIDAAHRHDVFNYSEIADYYAKASDEMKKLMEESALVIIDYQSAIANGYVRLNMKMKELFENE